MFYIDECGMHISRGDSADITTIPKTVTENGELNTVTLKDDACVIFTVKSKYSRTLLIKRVLTGKNYSDNALAFSIATAETDVEPYGYEYSYMYVPDKRDLSKAHTYEHGDFEILPSVSKVDDLGGSETTEQYSKSDVDRLLEDKANVDDVYNKTDVDSLLLSKADTDDVNGKLNAKADSSDLTLHTADTDRHVTADEKAAFLDKYTKSEIDELLEGKSGISDSYSKSQTDALLAEKADSANVYSKADADSMVAAKVAEIVAGAPEEYDTLKEMSDWLTDHEESAAAMNTAILQNTADIASHNNDTAVHVTAAEKAVYADKYTKSEIDGKLGDIQSILAAIVEV